jgi:hypothetical protein
VWAVCQAELAHFIACGFSLLLPFCLREWYWWFFCCLSYVSWYLLIWIVILVYSFFPSVAGAILCCDTRPVSKCSCLMCFGTLVPTIRYQWSEAFARALTTPFEILESLCWFLGYLLLAPMLPLCPLVCCLDLLVVLWYLLSSWIVVLIFHCGLLCPGSVLVHCSANWVVPLHLWLCYSVALCTIANYFVALCALAYYLLALWAVACSCCLCRVVLLIYGCLVRNYGPSN